MSTQSGVCTDLPIRMGSSVRLHVTVKDFRTDGIFPTKAGADTYAVTYGANEGVFTVPYAAMVIRTNPVTATKTITANATINGLTATSASGVVTTQDMYTADNTTALNFTLYPPGPLHKSIMIATANANTLTTMSQAMGSMRRGESAIQLGSQFGGGQNGSTNRVGAYNLFTKLDVEGFTVTGLKEAPPAGVTILYGALPSGGNWASDNALEAAREEDLEWYTSLADMGTKKCVGVLGEYRGEGVLLPSGTIYPRYLLSGYVPGDARVNRVYEAVNDLKLWYNDVGAAMTAANNTILVNKGAANPKPSLAQFTSNTAITGVETSPYTKRTYNMTTYQTTGGHTEGYFWGTSWLVTADYVAIEKDVLQTTDNTAEGSEKAIFSLNNGERRVDYAITPTFSTGGDSPGAINDTVTVVDTLPKYMTYVPGSSFVGGDYVYGDTSQNGYHTGGTAKEPTVSVNATTGITTLTWKFSTIATAHGDVDVTNDGDGDAHDVLAFDAIPDGTTYIPDSAKADGVPSGEYSSADNGVHWRIPFIAPAHTVRLSFQVSVNVGTDAQLISNTARYIDPENRDNPGDPNEWPETNHVDFQKTSFSKASDPVGGTTQTDATNVKVGDVIHYTLTLDTVAELYGVTMSDNLPDGLRLEMDSIGYALADGTTVNLADTYLVGDRITWPMLATVPTGRNLFTFSAVVERLDP